MTRFSASLAALAFSFCLAPGAHAMQQAEDDPLSPVLDCREAPGDAERLACFDDATAALAERRSGGAFVVERREPVEQAEREAFGLPNPSVGGLARSLGGLFTSESEPGGPRHDAVDAAEPARATGIHRPKRTSLEAK